MAIYRLPRIHITTTAVPILRGTQRRWAQVHDVRFLVTHQRSDSITEKYKDKLHQKAKEEGLQSVDELKAVYQERIQAEKKRALASKTSSPIPSAYPPPPPPPQAQVSQRQPRSDTTSTTQKPPTEAPGIKTLSSYIDIPKTLALPSKEIEVIWRLRHASSPKSLCATIPHADYLRIEATARRHPQFILPLPREGQGAEIHFLQWTFPTPMTPTILFTHLAEFKLRGEYAQPHTTVTHHLDIAEEKGLVLLRGEVLEGRGVSVEEGKWLLMCLQKFYGGEVNQERRKLLEQFSQGDGGFKVEELLEEAEKIG